MDNIDHVLKANNKFALDYDPDAVSPSPRLRLAVVTCMDTRLSRESLGLAVGDAHLIRNAGGVITEDAIRSLLISHYLLGTNEFMVVNHTDCGLLKATEEELRNKILPVAGMSALPPFHAFTDVEQNVREQLRKLATLKWVRDEIQAVRGFMFDIM